MINKRTSHRRTGSVEVLRMRRPQPQPEEDITCVVGRGRGGSNKEMWTGIDGEAGINFRANNSFDPCLNP